MCKLAQILVSAFTDKFVCIGILRVNIDVWLHWANLMDPNLSLQWHFQKSNQRYVCMYADGICTNSSGTLHWREYVGYCDSISTELSQN